MLQLMQKLASGLAKDAIACWIWKNMPEAKAAIDGHGDLDLYIAEDSRMSFLRLLHDLGFIKVHSPYDHPFVEHHLGFDKPSGSLCHLHCYFRIVTGESHLKQFILPINRYLKRTTVDVTNNGFPELDHEIQRRLHIFRRNIKLSSLTGLILYLRERTGYEEEYHRLEPTRESHDQIMAEGGWLADIDDSRSPIGALMTGLWYRVKYSHLSRFNVAERFWFRYYAVLQRLVNRWKRRKKTLNQGVIIALVGLDGSGKSSGLAMLEHWLSGKFSVETIHYGLGRRTVLTLPLRLLLRLRARVFVNRKQHSLGSVSESGAEPQEGLIPAIRYVGLAWERRVTLQRALRRAASGYIVLSDRWYSLQTGAMDSPRMSLATSGSVQRSLARLEHWLYSTSFDPDLLLKISVVETTAIQRNRERDKPGKESDEEISTRFRVNSELPYRAARIVEIDAEQAMDLVHDELRRHVWQLMQSNQ